MGDGEGKGKEREGEGRGMDGRVGSPTGESGSASVNSDDQKCSFKLVTVGADKLQADNSTNSQY